MNEASQFRSFVNPVNNVLVFDNKDVQDTLIESAVLSRLSPQKLPLFLHEVTHHWCFNSPAIYALTLLSLRGRRASLYNRILKREIDERLYQNDIIKYEFLISFFQPLLEGMALFAEHDILTGDAEVISLPFYSSLLAFNGRDYTGDICDNINKLLRAARFTPSHIRRKANLLLEPLHTESGGYLSGYLLIKHLHLYISKRCSKLLINKDLFLYYFKSFILDDWQLVDLILKNEVEVTNTIENVIAYLTKRLRQFINADHKKLILEFEKRSLENTTDATKVRIGNGAAIDILAHTVFDYDKNPEFKKQFVEQAEAFFKLDEENSLAWSFQRMDYHLFVQRPIVYLGNADVEAQITCHGRFNILDNAGKVKFSKAAHKSFDKEWKGRITVHIVAVLNPVGIYFIYTDDKERVKAIDPLTDSVVSDEVMDYLTNSYLTPLISGQYLEMSNQCLSKTSEIIYKGLDKEGMKYLLNCHKNDYYSSIALIGTLDSELENVKRLMWQEGFSNILNYNKELILNCTKISLASSNEFLLSNPIVLTTFSNLKPDEAVKEINEITAKKIGHPVFLVLNSGAVFSFV